MKLTVTDITLVHCDQQVTHTRLWASMIEAFVVDSAHLTKYSELTHQVKVMLMLFHQQP